MLDQNTGLAGPAILSTQIRDGAQQKRGRHWRILVGWLGTAVILGGIHGPSHAQQGRQAAPQQVIVALARVAEFVDRVEALGTTRANETVRISSNVTEKVAEIRFDDGQTVTAGQLLVVLEKAEEEADLAAAEAVLAERRLAFERAEKLELRKFTATAQLDVRRAALREAEARIEAVKSRIADRVLRAPFSGVVGLRNISVGALVEPGDLITTLDDLSVIKVDFTVPTTYLATLRLGLPIVAKARAFADRAFEGKIKSIGSRVDPVTRSVVARAVLPNDDGKLRPGLLMSVELLKNPRRAIVVPEHALVPRGRRHYVFVVDGGEGNTVMQREVEIGARRPGEVEIVKGLTEGEKVISRGALQVRPGQKVIIKAVEEGKQPLQDLLRSQVGG